MRQHLRLALAAAALVCAVAPSYSQTEWSASDRSYEAAPQPYVGSPVSLSGRGAVDGAGYWVIVGSVPTDDPVAWERAGRAVIAKTANCGFEAFNDFSENFVGFRPGYNVFVLGPHGSPAAAEPTRQAVSRCVADAYVKYGEHYVQ